MRNPPVEGPQGSDRQAGEALIQRQLERERLRELIEEAEAEHGPMDQAAAEVGDIRVVSGSVTLVEACDPEPAGPASTSPSRA